MMQGMLLVVCHSNLLRDGREALRCFGRNWLNARMVDGGPGVDVSLEFQKWLLVC